MDSTHRGRAALLTAAGVVVSLAVVAIASRGSTPGGSGGSSGASGVLLDVLLTLYVVALVAGALFFIYLLALRRKLLGTHPGAARRRDLRNLVALVLCAALALLTARSLGERAGPLDVTLPEAAPFVERGAEASERKAYDPKFAWIPALVTAGLIALAVLGVWWSERTRRRARGEGRESLLADALEAAVDESLDDLRAEADPRRAVVAAYARLERVLGSHGLPRHPAEAPLEYLRRLLGQLSVSPGAARRLTELFERAKFSEHAVGPEMKEQAIAALEVVRDDLRAARARAEEERAAAPAALAGKPAPR